MSDPSSKKPIYKRWWFWVVAVFVFFIVVGSLGPSQPSDSSQTVTESEGTNTGANVASQPQTTTDLLWQAVDDGLNTRNGKDIAFDAVTGLVTLTDTPPGFFDATMTVRHAQADLVYFGQKAFSVDGVKSVRVILKLSFVDQYGNQAMDDSVRISMAKTEFSKYNWANLVGLSIEQQLQDSAIEYYVHPAVLKEVNVTDLHLENAP